MSNPAMLTTYERKVVNRVKEYGSVAVHSSDLLVSIDLTPGEALRRTILNESYFGELTEDIVIKLWIPSDFLSNFPMKVALCIDTKIVNQSSDFTIFFKETVDKQVLAKKNFRRLIRNLIRHEQSIWVQNARNKV